ncbi:MAG: DsrE/DsrF/DrsH-like family protein [Alphaproteobacteria bacterium]
MAIDKLSLVLHSGDFSRLHYGMVLAATGVGTAKPVTILFAGDAVRLLAKSFVVPDEEHRIKALRVAGFEELLTSTRDLGARLLVCETALALAEIKEADLRDDLNLEITGAATFLADASADGQMLFV